MGMGNTCSDIPELAANIVKAVKDVATIPVWAKLSPNVTSIKHLAVLCANAGADGISAINTVKGFAGIDIETGMPKMNVGGSTTHGGLSGSIIKPIALKAVADIALSVNCPISGMGGIMNWQDSMEFVMLGASTVQICTEAMLNGYGIIHGLKKGMESYLDRHGIKSLQDVCGKSLKYIKNHSALDNSCKFIPQIKTEKCVKCGKCRISCCDAGFQAVSIKSDNFPEVDRLKCTGCGLCHASCPTGGCIEFVDNASIS
jgi:dihydropyrimidine dehydrogenase (NAD+) subunit PreA